MSPRLRSIKIENETWERWQGEARGLGVSLTALIIERMDLVPALTKERDEALVRVAALEKAPATKGKAKS